MQELFYKKITALPPLTADLLVHKIYSLIEENIINMVLPPGSKLVEDDIARTLRVSRSPVREALIQLESAGLVVRNSGKGRVVASFTGEEILANYEVWEMTESFIGGLTCLTAHDEDFQKIEDILNMMKGLTVAEEDFKAYRQLNYKFHHHMVSPCPNKILLRTYELALKPIMWCWNLSIFWPRDLSRSYAEHQQIFNAYRCRDRAEYEALVRKHIKDASQRFYREYSRTRKTNDST
jgi:DNA-binding GntR family transcriptional regulator